MWTRVTSAHKRFPLLAVKCKKCQDSQGQALWPLAREGESFSAPAPAFCREIHCLYPSGQLSQLPQLAATPWAQLAGLFSPL